MEPVQNKIIPLLYIVLIGNIGNSVTRCLGASVPRVCSHRESGKSDDASVAVVGGVWRREKGLTSRDFHGSEERSSTLPLRRDELVPPSSELTRGMSGCPSWTSSRDRPVCRCSPHHVTSPRDRTRPLTAGTGRVGDGTPGGLSAPLEVEGRRPTVIDEGHPPPWPSPSSQGVGHS